MVASAEKNAICGERISSLNSATVGNTMPQVLERAAGE
jgi:hypothetical protein